MPFPGDIVTTAARSSSLATIGRLAEHAAREADALGDDALATLARKPFALKELSPNLFTRFYGQYRDLLVWTDEGNCFNRAMMGAHLLSELSGIGRSPVEDTFAAALAVKPYTHNGGGYTGAFHTRLAVRIQGVPDVQVVDPLPGNVPVSPLGSWLPGNETMLLHPWAGTGIPFSDGGARSTYVNRVGFESADDFLEHTWRNAGDFDVRVTP